MILKIPITFNDLSSLILKFFNESLKKNLHNNRFFVLNDKYFAWVFFLSKRSFY